MSLRILLADESSTIKKVIELALQEHGVEVKSVNIGVDVLSVAKSFQPHIIFADVLLQKRNGYDVCHDIKNDNELKTTPVILMWSGFMELDEAKLTQAAPDDKLEKPFNADQLKQLIDKYSPQKEAYEPNTEENNPVANFLSMPPEVNNTQLDQSINDEHATSVNLPPIPEESFSGVSLDDLKGEPEEIDSHWQMTPLKESFNAKEEQEDFSQINLKEIKEELKPAKTPQSEQNEAQANIEDIDLTQFTIDLPENNEEPFSTELKNPPPHTPVDIPIDNLQVTDNLEEKIEELITKHIQSLAQKVIEEAVIKIVPDIAEKLISQELDRLLKETENSI